MNHRKQKKTTRHYHLRRYKSGKIAPVRTHQMKFWGGLERNPKARWQVVTEGKVVFDGDDKKLAFRIARGDMKSGFDGSVNAYVLGGDKIHGATYNVIKKMKDSDKDGVPDPADCNPRNSKKQDMGVSIGKPLAPAPAKKAIGEYQRQYIPEPPDPQKQVGSVLGVLKSAEKKVEGGLGKILEERGFRRVSDTPTSETAVEKPSKAKEYNTKLKKELSRLEEMREDRPNIDGSQKSRRYRLSKADRLGEKLREEELKFEMEKLEDEKRLYHKVHKKKGSKNRGYSSDPYERVIEEAREGLGI